MSTLSSTYNTIGGIESCCFNVTQTPDQNLPFFSPYPITTRPASETLGDSDHLRKFLESVTPGFNLGACLNGIRYTRIQSQQATSAITPSDTNQTPDHDEPMGKSPFQNLASFDPVFSFEVAVVTAPFDTGEQVNKDKAAGSKPWHDPSATTQKKIEPIEETHQRISRYPALHDPPRRGAHTIFGIPESPRGGRASKASKLMSEEPCPLQGCTMLVPLSSTSRVSAFASATCDMIESKDDFPCSIALGIPYNFFCQISSWNYELLRLHQVCVEQIPIQLTSQGTPNSYTARALPRTKLSTPTNISLNDENLTAFPAPEEVTEGSDDRALARYHKGNELPHKRLKVVLDTRSETLSIDSKIDDDGSWRSHSSGRLFLSFVGGEQFAVNPQQPLYNMHLIDENASDFDSTASARKTDSYGIFETTNLDDIESTSDNYTLPKDGMDQGQCSTKTVTPLFGRCPPEEIETNIFEPLMADNLGIDHDLFHDFSAFGVIHAQHSDLLSDSYNTEEYREQTEELQTLVSDAEQSIANGKGHFISAPHMNPYETLGGEACSGIPGIEQPIDIDTEDVPIQLMPTHDAAELLPATEDVAPIDDKLSTISVSADWAAELARTMLGTESLFTYLSILEVEQNGNATKAAVISAFLKVINFERQKLGEALLPQTCAASSMLGSRILPHTMLVGTTSLASFLAEMQFDANMETTVLSVYEAFKKLSEKELCTQKVAAMGVMGTLGRALGRLG
ncbi:hypothetical protein BKA66DRAFT_436368 [Pyrenochaeta sp. MPI-SDFR-AT-0127]|nr:hypothetical protein BKA66DRAFT_436368 [Pyrenochaeta sp. MPI-SDFR-AT-0127]